MKKIQTLTLAIFLTSALSIGTVGAHENSVTGMDATTGSTSINTQSNVNNYGAYGTNTGTISSPAASPSTRLNQAGYSTGINSYSTNTYSTNSNSVRAYDTANSGSNASNWGWLGLIGLLGLAGMRSRNHAGER
jgi:MYXO-CTERM domain-containing protein